MKKVLKAYLTICLSVLILCFIGCGVSNQESISSSQNHDYNNVSKNTNMITKPEGKESEKTKEENRDKEGKEESLKDNKNENKDSLNKDKDVLNKDANNSNKKSDQAVDKNKKDNNASKEVKKTSKTSSSVSQESNKKILDENQNKDKSQNKKIENREDEDYFTFIVSKDMKGKISKKPQILLKKQIKVSKDKNAMTYLRENCAVIENGGFIKSINGNHNLYPIPNSKKTEEQKKNKILGIDWFIYLNEKKSSVGVNDIIPIKGDILHLDIHEWDKSEFSF